MSSGSPEYSPFFAVMGASAAMVFSGTCTNLIDDNLVIIHCLKCVCHIYISVVAILTVYCKRVAC